ncbi:hypothetical protein GCM10008910_45190 [Faecalicatena orotica]|uniref:Uncharacterized protein n=1 Tax=Faecalicatena orotica TaxID=1544 RepID=A0A2Y9BDH5_9FIRM|nr:MULTISPECIES: hypothetical protein [Clostridia]PWJ29537.1 hypothetical protein A8806_106276 [Faecalicatena orotica]SSA55992.1 hypothetical protein SAMN05216536_106276 [Faecalicatena orotica]
MKKRVCKILKTVVVVFAVLFGLSLIVYYFNLDMKLAAGMQKIMDKVYDSRKRDRRL